jgi:hypothetical protein
MSPHYILHDDFRVDLCNCGGCAFGEIISAMESPGWSHVCANVGILGGSRRFCIARCLGLPELSCGCLEPQHVRNSRHGS